MSDCAHLVFVEGPQAGQQVSLHGERVVAGRSPQCQLRLSEHYSSREQMRFTKTPDGWVMENLSANGTVVNGKRYKAGAQIILATGDLLGVGLETVILFVAEKEDTRAALADYRQGREAAAEVKPAAPPPASTKPAKGELPPPPEDSPEPVTGAIVTLSEDEIQAKARKAKLKKYLVMLGVSVAATLGIVLLANTANNDNVSRLGNGPAHLTDEQIRDAIEEVPHDIRPDPSMATDALDKAEQYYQHNFREGDIYLCVKYYKLYLAYRGDEGWGPDKATQERNYNEILNGNGKEQAGLVKMVRDEYERVIEFEQAQRWSEAMQSLEKILKLVPEEDLSDPTCRKLVGNVLQHRTYVRSMMPQKK